MTLAGFLVFSTAYALAVASPGPGNAAVVSQVLGRGLRTAPAVILGILAGDFLWLTVAAMGLAAIAKTFAGVFVIIKWASAAYLLYIAWRMWTTPTQLR